MGMGVEDVSARWLRANTETFFVDSYIGKCSNHQGNRRFCRVVMHKENGETHVTPDRKRTTRDNPLHRSR